ncbi:Receptor-type tyrosine-protein phosphatase R [Acropora cervicornis]|uniref:Receptor-type tyrosine-protein phosphatase R n=1 Tax=Acropora cervicornis TaxID=6130 RepID=A0AAD9V8W8_ACRCE|nr:Receptor-type tyrosine-protein phosphatase R [Acropora cervicornis]
MRCWYYFVGSQEDFCDGGKMVVRFFQFLWLLWILTSSEAKTTFIGTKQAVDRTAYRTSSYGGRVTTRYFHEAKPIKYQNTPSEGVLKTYYGRKNSKMNSKRRVSQLKPKRNNTTRQTRNSLSSTVHEDLPELYILVLSLGLYDKSCVIHDVIPISIKRVQVELYCEKNMAQAMGSDWEPNIFIPAEKMIRTLDSPNMQSFRKEFNITAYGVKDPPETDLAVYQEMWFPVAVVAGVTLFCRRRIENEAKEALRTQQLDPEKLCYPAVDPANTMSTSMIQPGARRAYTLTGLPAKSRKGKGSNLSLSDSPTEEKLASKSKPLSYDQLDDCEIPMNYPPSEERLPGSSYRNRYPFIIPSPLSCTLKDFWRMIWYHHCPIIVMITKLKERNETKCERYWPDPTFKMQEKYGDIVVTFDSAIGRDGYQITSLYISDSQSLEAPRRVYHYWYTAWPDHGVPDSPRQFLRLVEEVHIAQEREDVKEGPVVVHCRGGMVELDIQYELVYNTLHHYWSTRTGSEEDGPQDIAFEAIFDE